jgi:chromosome segregation ATPase
MSIELLTYADLGDGLENSPGAGHQPDVAALRAQITELEDEITKLELVASGHRADYERERERADRLMTEMLKTTADLMAAKEAAARLEGELATLRSQPQAQRIAG